MNEHNSLLDHLIYCGYEPEDYLECLKEIEQAGIDKDYFLLHPEEASEEVELIDNDIVCAQERLLDMLKGWKRCDRKDMEAEINAIREYVAQERGEQNKS